MSYVNFALFDWTAAGFHPVSWLLTVASVLSAFGPWVCTALLGWTAWRRPADRGYAMLALVAAAVASFMAHAIADAVKAPRPFVLGLSPAWIAHGASGSMPSTHATVMSAMAWLLLLRPGVRLAGGLALVLALSTGWARIYAGVHFPFDIAAGFALGAVVAALAAGLRVLAAHVGATRLSRPPPPAS